jgi:plasmid stabilization system protein ParE
MPYRILWADRALARLEEQADFIAAESPGAAQRMLEQVFLRVEGLAEMPRFGRAYPGADDPDLRELVVGAYRAIYRVAEQERVIQVLTIRHGRQRPLSPGDLG